ncbi:MAG: type II secretion system protein GspE [Candidatus Rokuibacteriota bacterium]|nr:MAG: type II secretion system protein GspE [Candidatus Rokubacteria bacterium]
MGEILLAGGAITKHQLEHALAQQASLKLPLGKVLLKLEYITDETMRQALSAQLNVPFIDLEKVTIDRGLARLINRSYARRHSLLPIAQVGRTVTVAMDDPTAGAVIDDLMRLTGLAITVVTAPSRAIQRAFRRLYDGTPEAGKKLGNDVVTEVEVPVTTLGPSMLFDEQTSRRADELFRQILSRALENHCSDIHLEMLPSGLHVRHRVDGVLRQPHFGSLQDSLDHNMREIMSRIKILATLDIAERRRPQDGSFQVTVERAGSTVTIDLRVSVIPSYSGESVVIRILDRTRAPRSITELDLSPTVSRRLEVLLQRTTGIFLVTGPTGSGKSTTLYAVLMKLHRPEIRILTAENPVEYVYDELSQSEVNDAIGNTFASYLRAFLRHDPEIIMVGEIRDQETAEMAFRAAQTGHLLLSTLHTNSAIATLPRLLDLKIESSLIASSLIGVMSQRLVRRTCLFCRQPYTPSPHVLNEFFQPEPVLLKFYQGAGCAECGFSGYKGRMIVADLWVPDDQDAVLITRQAPFDEIRESAQRTTFSMAEDAHERLVAGLTTPEELFHDDPAASSPISHGRANSHRPRSRRRDFAAGRVQEATALGDPSRGG